MMTDDDLEQRLATDLRALAGRARCSPSAEDAIGARAARLHARRRRQRLAAAAVVVPALLAGAAVLFAGRSTDRAVETYTTAPEQPTTTTTAPPPLERTPRIAVFGDSTALMTGWGLAGWMKDTGRGTNVEGETGLGCGIVRAPERRIAGNVQPNPPECHWPSTWPDRLEAGDPDVAIVESGHWDVADVRLEAGGPWLSFGDPGYDEYVLGEMLAAVDLLSSNGATVVWLTAPLTGNTLRSEGDWNPRERLARYNQLVEQLPALRPGKVVVVDLASWVASLAPEEDARLRPDGVHFTEETSYEVCERYLCEAVLDAVR